MNVERTADIARVDPGRVESQAIRHIARQTLPAQVAERIRDMIAEDLLHPGEKLNELKLAETLNVSRTPLREGIKLVASEGLVDLVPNRGAFVANPDPAKVEDMLTALGGIEATAAELACVAATGAAIAALRAIHERMLKAYERGDRLTYFKLNQQIHLGLAAASGNATLQRMHATLNARLYRVRFLTTSPQRLSKERWKTAVEEHEWIITALEGRDAARLSQLLKRHLGSTWNSHLSPPPAVVARRPNKQGNKR
ncbi:MAG: GntR family transcriptional regulator [Terriglobales bacterium]